MKRTIETKFYTFDQNNSGGYYEEDKQDGVAPLVIVEAMSSEDARRKARDITCGYTDFCECCGERWGIEWVDEEDATSEPMKYGKPVKNYLAESSPIFGHKAAIHYLDKLVWLEKDKEPETIRTY